MTSYRVRVESYVVVEARNAVQAKAWAELALRKVVSHEYTYEELGSLFADGWHLYGWEAKKAVKVTDDE